MTKKFSAPATVPKIQGNSWGGGVGGGEVQPRSTMAQRVSRGIALLSV